MDDSLDGQDRQTLARPDERPQRLAAIRRKTRKPLILL
jgi:hypothetical protein